PRATASPELRERLEREARTIAQLSHPHICALHDIGRQGSVDFLVMEYLEGETLAERLARDALALERVYHFGAQIAEAIGAAHAAGVVHRDLKPANVMLTKSGVKLLDFGIATILVLTTPIEDVSSAATDLTREGARPGTMSYISPEQLEGRPAHAGTDIFALGAVLYE